MKLKNVKIKIPFIYFFFKHCLHVFQDKLNEKVQEEDIFIALLTVHVLITSSGASSRVIFVGGPAVTFTLTNPLKFWYLKHNCLGPGKPSAKRTPVTTIVPVLV